jgi:hypothetical protein
MFDEHSAAWPHPFLLMAKGGVLLTPPQEQLEQTRSSKFF